MRRSTRLTWLTLAGSLVVTGCWGSPDVGGDAPERATAKPDPGAHEAELEPTPEAPPPPPVALDDDAATVWERLHAASQAASAAPDWPISPDRFPADGGPYLRSRAWYVVDEDTGALIAARNAEKALPIASITKLATAMVWSDAEVPSGTEITLEQADKEHLQITRSRLRVGGVYRTDDLLYSALLASDNRAAVLLSRSTDLPAAAFTEAMNLRAAALGLDSMSFDDPTGLAEGNQACARDVARLLAAASSHPRVGPALLVPEHRFRRVDRNVAILARVSNKLTHMDHWTVRGAKTGFTNVAGSCLVMRAQIGGRNVVAAFLGARGIETRYGDAGRLRAWIEAQADAEVDAAQAPSAVGPS